MNDETLTAFATVLLVVVGMAQVGVLVAQQRQGRLDLIEVYRKRWFGFRREWCVTVFLGRDIGEYYQVADKAMLEQLSELSSEAISSAPTLWALDSIRLVCGTLSDICLKILQGQLAIGDVYPVFGSDLLRHTRPLRTLLDNHPADKRERVTFQKDHHQIRQEVQDWLVYHDGIRRRCLILIDLLWAEAARLEDLPPSDLRSAAESKKKTGKLNKLRLRSESSRLNGLRGIFRTIWLSRFLGHSEYRSRPCGVGIDPKRLKELETDWTRRLLHDPTWTG